jgi:hypothetical protein
MKFSRLILRICQRPNSSTVGPSGWYHSTLHAHLPSAMHSTSPAVEEHPLLHVSHGPIPFCVRIVLWISTPAIPPAASVGGPISRSFGDRVVRRSWHPRSLELQRHYVLPAEPGVEGGCACMFGVP